MSNFIVNTDIPNLRVVIREGDQYNINIVPGRITTLVTGSFTSYADFAGVSATASYVSGASVTAQFATSASYAQTINRQITGSVVISDDLTVQGIISAEKLLVSSSVIYESGSTKFGDSSNDTHQFTGSVLVQGPIEASTGITGSFKGDGSQLTGLVTDLRISGSTGSDTLNLLTDDLTFSASKGIEVAVTNNKVTIEVPVGLSASLYGTASVAEGIHIVSAGIYLTGSDGVIIPAPSGGYTYISTASYALTASYIANNTWNNLLNIPTGLLSSSVQVYPLPIESASYALTASYAMNGGGGGGAGSSGTSGTSGANGTSGSSGTSGQNGSSGSSGTTGSSGSTGTSGSSGISGSSGTAGSSGTTGSSGTSGISPSLPTGTVSSSAQVIAALPAGTVSSSLQISTGSFTGSFTGSLTGTITSASYAITASYASNATATVPTGTVSSSTQISNLAFVTSSATASFAITGSNTFVGNQTISGSLITNADTLTFSGSIYSTGSNIHTGTQIISGSLTVTGSGTLINIGPGVFSGSVNVTEGVTGSLLGTSSWANQSITASYAVPSGLPSGVVSSSAQIANFGNIRLAVGTNRSNSSAFYFNSNTRTASDSSSPAQDTAFLINSTGLTTVRVFLRQDNAGPNATIVGVAKNANGSAFSTATLLTSSSLSLTQDTIQTYTFSGLTLNQFDAVHIYCDPTSTPGSMFAVVVIS
jgi:collagen type VII alpha